MLHLPAFQPLPKWPPNKEGDNAENLGLDGNETFTITGISVDIKQLKEVQVIAENEKGEKIEFKAIARLDSLIEIEYYRNGGILQYPNYQDIQSFILPEDIFIRLILYTIRSTRILNNFAHIEKNIQID